MQLDLSQQELDLQNKKISQLHAISRKLDCLIILAILLLLTIALK